MISTIRLAVMLLLLLPYAPAQADPPIRRAGPPGAIGPLPPLDQAGCYYYRGREYCGRYCYYEVNGKRYCNRFERHARPQVDLPPPPESFK